MPASKAKQKLVAKKTARAGVIRTKGSRGQRAKSGKGVPPIAVPVPLVEELSAPIPGVPSDADLEAQLTPISAQDRQTFTQIRNLVAQHLGSFAAARLWFVTVGPGYAMTPLEAVREGRGKELLELLENQWGPNPTYA